MNLEKNSPVSVNIGGTRIVTYNYNIFHFGKVNSIKME